MRSRSQFVHLLWLLPLLGCRTQRYEEVVIEADSGFAPMREAAAVPELRFSVAAIRSPTSSFEPWSRLSKLLAASLSVEGKLIQRRTYRETNDLLISGAVDVAMVCTGGYFDLVQTGAGAEVLAVPVVRGQTTYHSFIIVPAQSQALRLLDLEGKRFAFTDELSLSGHAYPVFAVRRAGRDPRRFFSSAYFTHSHDRAIEAVTQGLVDGAAIDSNSWLDAVEATPSLAARVRVIERSDPLGISPVVALSRLPESTRARLRAALLGLHLQPEGKAVLEAVGYERFEAPGPLHFEHAFEITRELK